MKPTINSTLSTTASAARTQGLVCSTVLCSLQLLALTALLSACGGGGGSGSVSPGATVTQAPLQDTANATSLDDLVVDPAFNLQATFTLSVDIQLVETKRGYFSLCDQYTDSGNGVTVNYESCLLRGPLDAGGLKASLQVANHSRELMAVIWFYDGSEPIYQSWQYNRTETEQKLLIN